MPRRRPAVFSRDGWMIDACSVAEYPDSVAMRPWRASSSWRSGVSIAVLSILLPSAPASHAASVPLSNAGPVLEEFGKQAQDQTKSESDRLQTISLLALWATDEVRAPLIAVLGDPSPTLRAAAARALGWKGNLGASAALRERLAAPDEEPSVRLAALEAIGRIGDDSTRPIVLAATRDPDPVVRGAAFRALAFESLRSPTDRIPLLRRVAEDKGLDPALRCQAIQELGGARDAGSANLLLRVLEYEPSVPMPPLSATPTEREIMAIRYVEARDVKAWAARVLWMIDERAAIPLLVKAADDPRNYFLRLVALQALGSWKVPEALPVFLRHLEDPFDQNRVVALWALAQVGDKSLVDPVLARLSDVSSDVRAQAVDTLGQFGDPRVRPELEALQQKDPDSRVQEALERALGQLPR